MGRHSEYTQEVADRVCIEIARGRSLVSILKEDDTLPCSATIYKWLIQQPEFAEKYARAREAQADVLFDEILRIADTPQIGVKTKTNDKGEVETTEGDMIEHRRLQVDARKWMAGKLRPKKYGDFKAVELSGPEGGPVQTVTRIELVALDKEQE